MSELRSNLRGVVPLKCSGSVRKYFAAEALHVDWGAEFWTAPARGRLLDARDGCNL